MKNLTLIFGLLPLCAVVRAADNGTIAFQASAATAHDLKLWYDKPAAQWVEALPVGNGRLGAMVFGGVEHERLQLNEGTLWAGGPYDPSNPEALKALPEARRLIFEGKYGEAHGLIGGKMMAQSASANAVRAGGRSEVALSRTRPP